MTNHTWTGGRAVLTTGLDFRGPEGGLMARLHREWPLLYRQVQPVMRGWSTVDPILARYGLEPGSRVELSYDEADAYLIALLERATHTRPGNPDAPTTHADEAGWAARIVLQLMLQSVMRLAHGLRGEAGDEAEAEAHAVAAMHEAIVRYPIDRRHRCAANLTFDALRVARHHLADGELIRGGQVQLSPFPGSATHSEAQVLRPSPNSASEELLWLLARAVERGYLTRDQAALLADGTAYGWSRRLARELGISSAAVRQRRRYAVGKLRASVADLDTSSDWLERRYAPDRRPNRRPGPDSAGRADRPDRAVTGQIGQDDRSGRGRPAVGRWSDTA